MSRPPVLIAFLVAAVLLVYGRTIAFEFVEFDDGVTVYENPGLTPVTTDGLKDFWAKPYRGIYAPVTFSIYAVESLISLRTTPDAAGRAMSPLPFHAGNVLAHIVCVLLVFAILRALIAHELAAFFGALVFALHPIQVETVAWITQMRGLVAFAFGLASIWFYIRARRKDAIAWPGYAAATLSFVLALLSKPAAAAIPLVVLVIEVGWFAGSFRRAALILTPWFALALGLAVITRGEQPGLDLPVTTSAERCCVAGDALAFYMRTVVAPTELAPIYDRAIGHALASPTLCWWWLLPVAFVVILWRLPGRRTSLVSFAIFAASLAPVLGFVPFEYQTMATVADRYGYLAMLGPALAVAAAIAAVPTRASFVLASAVAVVLGGMSLQQSSHWKNDDSLVPFAVARNPNSADMQAGLGNIAFRRGDLDAAERAYRAALVNNPSLALARRNLGLVFEQRGDLAAAVGEFRRAIEARPDLADSYRNLGRTLMKMKEPAGAIEPYRRAVTIEPDNQSGYAGLAEALLTLGRASEAETHLGEGVRRFPNWAEGHANLAAALAMQGKFADAAVEARRALALNPNLAVAQDTLEKVTGAK